MVRQRPLLRHNPRFSKLVVVLVSGEDQSSWNGSPPPFAPDAVVNKKDIRRSLATTVQRTLDKRSPPGGSSPGRGDVAVDPTS